MSGSAIDALPYIDKQVEDPGKSNIIDAANEQRSSKKRRP